MNIRCWRKRWKDRRREHRREEDGEANRTDEVGSGGSVGGGSGRRWEAEEPELPGSE